MTATANQKAFNKAYLGLKGQGFERSVDKKIGGGCRYRGPQGRRCAAGWLIPDSKYRESWEGYGIVALPDSLFRGADTGLLMCLQKAHDFAKGPDDMKRELARVAADFHLAIPA